MQNTGQILRSRKTGKDTFTPIKNDILQSNTLEPEEKSILVHLLSLPSDWVVYKGIIWKEMNMGRDRFNKHWKGLVEKGYVVSVRVYDKNSGQFHGWNHIVYEEPILSDRLTENPKVGISESRETRKSEFQEVYKIDNIQSNNNTKEVYKESDFEIVWNLYKKKGNKKMSQNKWDRLSKAKKEQIMAHLPLYIKNHEESGKLDFLPNFTTYLNQERWQDELPYVVFKKEETKGTRPPLATLD